jgi:hypothetical protein
MDDDVALDGPEVQLRVGIVQEIGDPFLAAAHELRRDLGEAFVHPRILAAVSPPVHQVLQFV